MATVNKDFKIKSGLIVEGTTATVNGYDILTKKQVDQDYIVDLIGGTADSANVANAVVKRDASGNFAAGTITADLTGQVSDISNHSTSDLSEGSNLYFTNQRALDATNAAYDAAGDAAYEAGLVASDLTDHISDTSAHGVTGAVVGTTDAQTLTNKTIGDTLNFTGAGAMTINSDSHIVLTPAAGSSVKWGADVLATQAYADQAESDAISTSETYTDTAITNLNLGTTYDAIGSAAQALADANSYTDTEIADLVGAAPALLDTLNELSAAIANNPSYATDAANAVAGRVAKSGDTMTGDLVLPGAPTLNLHAATKGYVDGEITSLDTSAQGYATTAQTNAEDYADGLAVNYDMAGAAGTAEINAKNYADGLAVNYDIAGAAATAETNAIAHADALTTDDVAEGTTQYFTDGRAKDSAGDLLAGATTENVNISYVGGILSIIAENGVAGSDTDDLTEGATNLYFTDNRAYDAVNGTEIGFTAVNIDSVAKQVAATVSCPVAGINQAYGFDPEVYRSAEFLVKVAYGSHTEISKVLLTLDSSDNIAITEYGIVGTNGSASSISADISGGNVRLLATTVNNNSTVTVMGTLLV
jgi:hypothetical protein